MTWPKSRYVRFLEAEVERLRTELRQWQDALCKSRNLPTVTPTEPKPLPQMKPKLLPSQWIRKAERATMPKADEKPLA